MAPPIVTVAVKYAKPGVQPPIYLAGSFSNPAWQPQEMEYTAIAENEYEYHKEVQVEQGKEYQYKFRIGAGDWWILNEDAPTVTDDIGNRNNLLTAPAIDRSPAKPEQPHLSDNNPVPAKDSKSEENMEDKHHQNANDANESIGAKDAPATPEINEIPSPPAVVVENAELNTNSSSNIKEEEATMPNHDHLTAQSPSLDRTTIRNGARTPELADTAAEVADSAATLDHDQPTPPISDDEAGRIGYRRMSNTPIPQVAKVAAEVADVAAALDKEIMGVSSIEMPARPSFMEDDDDEEFDDTPWEERVPLFPHECPGPNDKVVASRHEHVIPGPSKPAEEEEIDYNDPSLIPFPTDREGIYAQILSIERHMPADEVRLDGTPPSAAVSSGLKNPSPRVLAQERSPSLNAITEEQEINAQHLNNESIPSNPLSGQAEDVATLAKSVDTSGAANQKSGKDVDTRDHQSSAVGKPLAPEDVKTQENKPLESSNESHTGHSVEEDVSASGGASTTDSASNNFHGAPQTTPTTHFEHAAPAEAVVEDAKPLLVVEETVESGRQINEEPKSPTKLLAGTGLSPQIVESPPTHFFVGDKQLGHDIQKSSTGGAGPSIVVQPATPRPSLGRVPSEAADTASSTAVAKENDRTDLKSRKQKVASISPADRPLTPTSIRSSHKDRNFLKAFWRVVFVEWIGGMIMKLCGGGRKTLLAISALVLIAVAPTLYFFSSQPLLQLHREQ